MTDIVIQKYAPGNKEELINMILAIQQQEYEIPIVREDQPDLANIPAFYQQANGNFWVALHASEVVGTVGLIDIGNQQVALRKMFVKASYRGNKYGVARFLLETLLDWAFKRGVQAIYLGTTDKFQAAHRFYEKNGFERIAKTELPSAFPVMRVDTVFYRLTIKNLINAL
jgi:GNAT superfamily N-acetyltransferase